LDSVNEIERWRAPMQDNFNFIMGIPFAAHCLD